MIEKELLRYCSECDVASDSKTCWLCGGPTVTKLVDIKAPTVRGEDQ
jgi:predicted RNA-binding protein with PUA domain